MDPNTVYKAAGTLPLAASTGRVLIPRRSRQVSNPRLLSVFGGHREKGEHPSDTADREFREEAGVAVPYTQVPLDRQYENTHRHYIAVVDDEFAPSLDHETESAEWLAPSEVRDRANEWHFNLEPLLWKSEQLQGKVGVPSVEWLDESVDVTSTLDEAIELTKTQAEELVDRLPKSVRVRNGRPVISVVGKKLYARDNTAWNQLSDWLERTYASDADIRVGQSRRRSMRSLAQKTAGAAVAEPEKWEEVVTKAKLEKRSKKLREKIREAAHKQHKIRMTYRRVQDNELNEYVVEPYSYRFEKSRLGPGSWRYLYAYHGKHRSIHKFLFRRIKTIDKTKRKYQARWEVEIQPGVRYESEIEYQGKRYTLGEDYPIEPNEFGYGVKAYKRFTEEQDGTIVMVMHGEPKDKALDERFGPEDIDWVEPEQLNEQWEGGLWYHPKRDILIETTDPDYSLGYGTHTENVIADPEMFDVSSKDIEDRGYDRQKILDRGQGVVEDREILELAIREGWVRIRTDGENLVHARTPEDAARAIEDIGLGDDSVVVETLRPSASATLEPFQVDHFVRTKGREIGPSTEYEGVGWIDPEQLDEQFETGTGYWYNVRTNEEVELRGGKTHAAYVQQNPDVFDLPSDVQSYIDDMSLSDETDHEEAVSAVVRASPWVGLRISRAMGSGLQVNVIGGSFEAVESALKNAVAPRYSPDDIGMISYEVPGENSGLISARRDPRKIQAALKGNLPEDVSESFFDYEKLAQSEVWNDALSQAQEAGYDGIVLREYTLDAGEADSYVVFDPSQVNVLDTDVENVDEKTVVWIEPEQLNEAKREVLRYTNFGGKEREVPYLVNPTIRDVEGFVRRHQSIRGLIDSETSDIYVWPADAPLLHGAFADKVGVTIHGKHGGEAWFYYDRTAGQDVAAGTNARKYEFVQKLMQHLGESIENAVADERTDESFFDYEKLAQSEVWNDALDQAQNQFKVKFGTENDEPIERRLYSASYQEDDMPRPRRTRVKCEMHMAGMDWENSLVYFRCQVVDGKFTDPDGNERDWINTKKSCFVYIPRSNEGNATTKAEKGFERAYNHDEFGYGKALPRPDRQKCWKSLKQYLDKCTGLKGDFTKINISVKEAVEDERDIDEATSPKYFRAVIDLDCGKREEHIKQLADGELEGVEGISDQGNVAIEMLGGMRDAMLVMPAQPLIDNGNVTPVPYDQPDKLVQDNLSILNRLFAGQTPMGSLRRVLDYGFKKVDPNEMATEAGKNLAFASRGNSFGQDFETKATLDESINNLDDLAKWIANNGAEQVAKKHEKSRSPGAGRRAELFREATADDWRTVLQKGLQEVADIYRDEGEWLVQGSTLPIPRDSRLYVLDPVDTRLPGSKKEDPREFCRQTLEKYGIYDKYKVIMLDRDRWERMKKKAIARKYGESLCESERIEVDDQPVLVNPTAREMTRFAKRTSNHEIRWAYIDGDIYVWDAYDLTHRTVERKIAGPGESVPGGYGRYYPDDGEFRILDIPPKVWNQIYTSENWKRLIDGGGERDDETRAIVFGTGESTEWIDVTSLNEAALGPLGQEAVEEFGRTENPNLAGYILTDGTLLDMSGGSGIRAHDHREVPGGMEKFQQEGHIRYGPEGGLIDLEKEPTREQEETIKELVDFNLGEVVVELQGNGGRETIEYDDAKPRRVLRDIDRYYTEGPRDQDDIDRTPGEPRRGTMPPGPWDSVEWIDVEMIERDRDYAKEYREYHGRPDQIARRSSRNKARRKLKKNGKVRDGDGKDVHHADGNPRNNDGRNLRATSVQYNRGDANREDIEESVFDQHALKAVILAGSGGSGKSYISKKMFGGEGLRVVNSDPALEKLMKDSRLDPKTDLDNPIVQQKGGLRDRAKEIKQKQRASYVMGRDGLIIDGTGGKPEKILRIKRQLEDLGYDVSMVLVDTPLEVALENNKKRDRVVPEEIVRDDWEAVQQAKPMYRSEFGDRYIEIDNSEVMSPAEIRRKLVPQLHREAMRLLDRPLENPKGKEWVRSQIENASPEVKKKILNKFGMSPTEESISEQAGVEQYDASAVYRELLREGGTVFVIDSSTGKVVTGEFGTHAYRSPEDLYFEKVGSDMEEFGKSQVGYWLPSSKTLALRLATLRSPAKAQFAIAARSLGVNPDHTVTLASPTLADFTTLAASHESYLWEVVNEKRDAGYKPFPLASAPSADILTGARTLAEGDV